VIHNQKIKQRNFENRLGLAPGTLSEEFATGKKTTPDVVAPVKPKPKAKAKPKTTKAAAKKKTTKKKPA